MPFPTEILNLIGDFAGDERHFLRFGVTNDLVTNIYVVNRRWGFREKMEDYARDTDEAWDYVQDLEKKRVSDVIEKLETEIYDVFIDAPKRAELNRLAQELDQLAFDQSIAHYDIGRLVSRDILKNGFKKNVARTKMFESMQHVGSIMNFCLSIK